MIPISLIFPSIHFLDSLNPGCQFIALTSTAELVSSRDILANFALVLRCSVAVYLYFILRNGILKSVSSSVFLYFSTADLVSSKHIVAQSASVLRCSAAVKAPDWLRVQFPLLFNSHFYRTSLKNIKETLCRSIYISLKREASASVSSCVCVCVFSSCRNSSSCCRSLAELRL